VRKFSVSVTFEVESNHAETIPEETLSDEIRVGVSEAIDDWSRTYGGTTTNVSFEIESETMTQEQQRRHRREAVIYAMIGIPLIAWVFWKDCLPVLRHLFSF
jgi:hypothetical protein